MINQSRKFITSSELFSLISSKTEHIIIDIRSKSEFDSYHISGAINLISNDLDAQIRHTRQSEASPVIIVSDREDASISAVNELIERQNIFYLKGGMREGWFPLVKHICANQLK